MELPLHDAESAPLEAAPIIEQLQQRYRFVPNLAAVMANAPAVLRAYALLGKEFDSTSLAPSERHVVMLATSVANRCHYCVAAHSLAATGGGLDQSVVDAIREERPIPDSRLEALRTLTTEIVRQRGWPAKETLDRFVAHDFSSTQLLEVLLGVTMKTLSNYTNHIFAVPLDAQFASAKWQPVHEEANGKPVDAHR